MVIFSPNRDRRKALKGLSQRIMWLSLDYRMVHSGARAEGGVKILQHQLKTSLNMNRTLPRTSCLGSVVQADTVTLLCDLSFPF